MARKPNTETSTANLGFEAKLWLTTDKLRNNIDAAEYKQAALGTDILLKNISDTFEEHPTKLLAVMNLAMRRIEADFGLEHTDTEAYAGGDIVILRPREADAVFLGYFLNTASINRQKASRGQGDAAAHISSSALGAIRSCIPRPAEQTAIAEVQTDMDADLVALERRREKTRALKQAMMQELLTDKTRLV